MRTKPIEGASADAAPPLGERVQLLYESAATSQWFALVVGAILVGTQWGAVDPAVLLPWFGCLALLSVSRLVSIAIYRRAAHPDQQLWYRRFFLAVGGSGLIWGSAALFLAGNSSPEQQVVVLLILAGMVAAAVPYLSIAPRVYYLYALLTFGPVVAIFFGRAGPLNAGMGAVGAVYLVGMLSAARRINRYMVSSLNLRRENAGLVRVLREANTRMEASNSALTVEIGERRQAEHDLEESLALVRATLESTKDGILVVDNAGNIVGFNNRFTEMWALRAAPELGRNGLPVQEQMLPQIKDAERFRERLREMRDEVAAESHDVLELMDGRVFERYSIPHRVAGSTVGRVWNFRDVSERVRAERDLHFIANHDHLTALPNRAMFSRRLQEAMLRAQRHAGKLAVLFIDLDRFKDINDTLGHHAGDRLLTEVAARLSRTMRKTDTIARLGGDEFVVLLEDLQDPEDAGRVAQHFVDVLAEPYALDGREIRTSASIGISTFPTDTEDLHSLLKYADIAMYRAKEQGRNAFVFYSATLNLHSIERLALAASLRHAVERDQLIAHYQPKVDLASGRVIGAEALLRWRHPDLGLIPPATFIPLAEENGLIVPMGEWVMRTACAEARKWQRPGAPVTVAVNLSAHQFRRSDLMAQVMRAVADSGLAPGLLELELTESAVMQNSAQAIDIMVQLRTAGVRLAIDDFGTGYSSLAYLKRFPIDSIKIDRSFVGDILSDPDDAAITRTVIAMAHSLRLKAVAEGIESAEQVEFLRRHGCDEAQGYFYGRPMPAAEFMAFLNSRSAAAA